MKTSLIVALCFFAIACKTKNNLLRNYMNEAALPLQSFAINTTTDNSLTSKKGVKLLIPKGTFTGAATVTIELKEALDYPSIIKAGLLTTTTDGNALSSAGMFYLGTKEHAKMNKPIAVSVPTKVVDADMELYKGKVGDDGITWENPVAIETDTSRYAGGKALFNANCASCHKLTQKLTGPALAGVTSRKSRLWLYRFTINPTGVMATDPYSQRLKQQYNGAMMTAFPALGLQGLSAIYNYIDIESEKLGYAKGFIGEEPVFDSCCYYKNLYNDLLQRRSLLIVGSDSFANDYYENWTDTVDSNSDRPIVDVPPLNNPTDIAIESVATDYYKFNIAAEGWCNLDKLVEGNENVKESRLVINIESNNPERMQVYMAIPSNKIFLTGGLMDDKKSVGFAETNGNLLLPQNEWATVFAMGEINGAFFFAKAWFSTKLDQTITLTPIRMTKEAFEKELEGLQLEDVKMNVLPNENLKGMIEIDAELEKTKANATGDCKCGEDYQILPAVGSDTTRKI